MSAITIPSSLLATQQLLCFDFSKSTTKMKLHVFNVSLALVTLVTCCSAVIIPDSAEHYLGNFQTAIEAANAEYPVSRGYGKFVRISPWAGDLVLYNNIALHLKNRPDIKYARVAEDGDYMIHAIDWKMDRTAKPEDPNDSLFFFATHKTDHKFVPLGFVRYQFYRITHAEPSFWTHTDRLYRKIEHRAMLGLPGFPPEMVAPRRAMKK